MSAFSNLPANFVKTESDYEFYVKCVIFPYILLLKFTELKLTKFGLISI